MLVLKNFALVIGGLATVVAILIALVIQPFTSRKLTTPPSVDPAQLEAHVKYLSVDLYPRSFEQTGNLNRAADYLAEQFKRSGASVTIQEFVVQDVTYKNVIARYGPATGPLMVIGAHYDTDGDANGGARYAMGYAPATHTPGADDNASGVAGLIELARLLKHTPPSRSVELVAYSLEEMPYFRTQQMGSSWHARSLAAQGREVELMLSLEMIGYFSDEPGSQHYPMAGMGLYYPEQGSYIALVGKLGDFSITRRVKALMAGASELPVYSINAPIIIPGIDFSDHRNFWAAGYPALMVTDTAFYRNPNYHDAEDTYEKLDYRRMAQVVESVFAVIQNY